MKNTSISPPTSSSKSNMRKMKTRKMKKMGTMLLQQSSVVAPEAKNRKSQKLQRLLQRLCRRLQDLVLSQCIVKVLGLILRICLFRKSNEQKTQNAKSKNGSQSRMSRASIRLSKPIKKTKQTKTIFTQREVNIFSVLFSFFYHFSTLSLSLSLSLLPFSLFPSLPPFSIPPSFLPPFSLILNQPLNRKTLTLKL